MCKTGFRRTLKTLPVVGGPIPGVVSDQRLRVPDAVITVAFNVRNQLIDAAKGFLVLLKPVEVIFPGSFVPLLFHLSSFAVYELMGNSLPRLHIVDCLQKQLLVVLVIKRIVRELFYTPIQIHPYGRLNSHHVYHHPHKNYLNTLSLASHRPGNATRARQGGGLFLQALCHHRHD